MVKELKRKRKENEKNLAPGKVDYMAKIQNASEKDHEKKRQRKKV